MNNTMEKITDFAMKLARPLAKFGEIKGIRAVTMGLMSAMPLTIIGSIFMLLNVFSVPGQMGIKGFALFPFLSGFADKFLIVYQVTLNFLGFWAALTIAQAYASLNNFDTKTAGLVGILSFFLLATNGPEQNAITTTIFGAKGLFISMLGSVLLVKLYIYLDRKNIKFKMPSSVPPYIGESFGALVPMLVIALVCFGLRQILNIDLVGLINSVLDPITVGAENSLIYGLSGATGNLLWFCGLHGASLMSPITRPLTTLFLT